MKAPSFVNYTTVRGLQLVTQMYCLLLKILTSVFLFTLKLISSIDKGTLS